VSDQEEQKKAQVKRLLDLFEGAKGRRPETDQEFKAAAAQPSAGGTISDLSLSRGIYWYCIYGRAEIARLEDSRTYSVIWQQRGESFEAFEMRVKAAADAARASPSVLN
jgi:hypothetical protein